MGTEQNKALYRRFIDEVFNQGRFERLGEFLAPDYVFRDASPGMAPGPEAIRETVTNFRTAFPDLAITLEELVAEGDKVCARSVMRGTHRGPLFGIAPTGRPVAVAGLTMVRLVEGRLVESWVKNDVTGLMAQIGADRR